MKIQEKSIISFNSYIFIWILALIFHIKAILYLHGVLIDFSPNACISNYLYYNSCWEMKNIPCSLEVFFCNTKIIIRNYFQIQWTLYQSAILILHLWLKCIIALFLHIKRFRQLTYLFPRFPSLVGDLDDLKIT